MKEAGWFPLKVRYPDTGEEKIVFSSMDIPSGVPFVILETKVNAQRPKPNFVKRGTYNAGA